MPFALTRPSTETLTRILAKAESQHLTYDVVGATVTGDLPRGYHHDRYTVPLGSGAQVFQRAKEVLGSWEPHRFAGAHLVPETPPLVVGTNLVSVFPVLGAFTVVTCRVVAVVDDGLRFGFAYGTLPGHPETGEELFCVTRQPNGEVSFDIVAFSRPHEPFVRLASPVARFFQRRVTGRYLEGMRLALAR